MKKVNNGFFDETISRDVFVAYSSKDKKKVIEIVNFLEKQDISCYVAFRNLEHGSGATENYQKKLNTAIDNSKVFLFMSSTNSRSKNCDALSIEMQYIKNEDKASAPPEYKRYSYDKLPNYYKKPRVEFIIEDYNGENIVGESISNEFFNEIERVYNKEELALRIFNLCQQDIDSIISKQNNSENKKSTDTKFCCYCSKENPIDAKFCINCGKSVFGITLSEAKNTLSLIESKAKETKTQKSTKTNTISKVVSPLNKESEALLFNKDDFVIENNVLKKYKGLATKVKVPEGVVEISSHCFYNSGIESVEIPSSVTKIGERAFAYCNNLIDIKINDSVLVLGEALFKYCKNLKSVKLPNKITEIPSEMFYNCEKLESVKIPNKVTEIGDYAFNNCLELKSINLPNSIKKIGDSSFHFAKLSSLVLPKNLVSIGDVAFRQNKITGEVVIPASVQKIGDSVFANNSIKEIVCEVSSVPAGWSNDWNKVNWSKSLTNPWGVDLSVRYSTKWKGELNKYDDYDIPDPIINNNVKNINTNNVKNNNINNVKSNDIKSNEKNIKENYTEIKTSETASKNFIIENDRLIRYTGDSESNVVIPEGVTVIMMEAFKNSKFSNIKLPSTLKVIERKAFYDCVNLKSILIPNGVTRIEYMAFCCCSSLESVTLPNSIRNIEFGTFLYCKRLVNITLPNNLATIKHSAFGHCVSLESITLPDTLKNIENSAFYNCMNLTSITLSNNLTNIEDSAFYSCMSLKSIVIPNSVINLGKEAFKFCINLSTIQLSKESKLKTISEYCFSCCYELKEITIPNSVENIEKYIFYSCDKLNVIKCVSAINRQKWDKLWNYRKIKGFLVFPIKTIYGYIE